MQIHKNTVFIITLLTSVLLFSATVAAIQFNPTQILDTWGRPFNFMSSDNPVVVIIVFNYTLSEGESFTVTSINATDLYPNGIYSGNDYSRLVPECKKVNNTSTNACTVKGLIFKTNNNNITITISGRYSNADGTVTIKNSTTLKLTIDNSKPIVTFLGTSTCYNKVCYVASDKTNKVQITLQDERATFEIGRISYKLGSNPNEQVDVCSGMTCNGSTKITCNDGEKIKLNIVHTGYYSKDDIGNKINYSSTEVVCDKLPPTIKSHSVASAIGMDTLVLGKDIIFEYNVTDTASPTMNMVINADSVLAGNVTVQCTKPVIEGVNFICRGIVKPTIDVAGEYEFKIIIKDIVGREATETLKLPVLKTTNETANNWKVASVVQSSTEFSRPNLEFERTLFTQVNLQALGNAEIVSIKPEGNCYATEKNKTGVDSDVVSVKLIAKQPTSVYLKVALRENNDGRYGKLDNLSFECPISIVSKRGNYYFQTPEKDNFSITIKLKDDKNIQQYHQNEIDKVTKNTQKFLNTANSINKIVTFGETICTLCGVTLPTTTGLLGVIESALGSNPATLSAAYPISNTANGLLPTTYDGTCKKAQESICKAMTCDAEFLKPVNDWMDENTVISKIGTFSGYESYSSSFNPYKSYVVAVSTGCLPAIAYHIDNFAGIQCNYLECITNDYVQYNQDISTCQQDKAYSECVYVWGGIFDAVPGVSMIRDVSGRIGNILKDPVQLFGVLEPFACKGLALIPAIGPAVEGVCMTTQSVLTSAKGILELGEIVQQTSRMMKSNSADSTCETAITNAKTREFNKLNRIGYTDTSFDPTMVESNMNIGGTLSCTGGDCKYEKSGIVYTLRVIPNSETGGKDVEYYYGNRKIEPNDIKSGNTEENYQQMVNYQEEFIRKKYDLAILKAEAEGNLPEANALRIQQLNEIKQFKLSPLLSYEQLKLLDEEAIKLSEQSYKKLYSKYPDLEESFNNLSKAQMDYAKVMKGQEDFMADTKDLENAEEYQKLLAQKLDEGDGKLSDAKEKRLLELYKQTDPDYVAKVKALNDAKKEYEDFKASMAKETDRSKAEENAEKLKLLGYKVTAAGADVGAAEIKFNENDPLFMKKANSSAGVVVNTRKEKLDKNTFKSAEKEKRKLLRQAQRSAEFDKAFGTWSRASMTAWGNAQTIAGLRTMFNINWLAANPDGKVAQLGDWFSEDVSQFEKAFCRGKIKPAERLGDTVIMNSGGDSVFQTGAQIGGRKSGLVNDGTKSYYEYWIQGNVVTSKRDGLIVDLILIDAEGKEVNATQRLLEGSTTLSQGVPFQFGRPSAKYFTDEINYDKICLVFTGGPISSYFDHVQGGNTDRICQKFIAE